MAINKSFMISVCFLILTLCGCSSNTTKEKEQIKVYGDSSWVFDDTTIKIPSDYSFKDFSKDYVDDEIIVNIVYRKSK